MVSQSTYAGPLDHGECNGNVTRPTLQYNVEFISQGKFGILFEVAEQIWDDIFLYDYG